MAADAPAIDVAVVPSQRRFWLGAGAAGAWALLVGAEITGLARYLHHDVALEGGLPASAGPVLFLAGWLVMVAAMMLPANVPVVDRWGADAGRFLAGFGGVWTVGGAAMLSVDSVVHDLVRRVSVLHERPSLVAAALLAVAGALQLVASTRRLPLAQGVARCAFGAGWRHGVRGLKTDGPLMLVMFAAGGSLVWMVLLTGAMTAQRSARLGPFVAVAAGVGLIASAGLVLLNVFLGEHL